MPGFNQTGPKGLGSKTGRGMGKCVNKVVDDSSKPIDPKDDSKEVAFQPNQQKGFGAGKRKGLGCQHRIRGGR